MAAAGQEQEPDQTEQQELTPTQQQATHQARWEKMARTTAETVVVAVPAVVARTAEHQETQVEETKVAQAASQGQTTRPVARKTMDREQYQVAQPSHITVYI